MSMEVGLAQWSSTKFCGALESSVEFGGSNIGVSQNTLLTVIITAIDHFGQRCPFLTEIYKLSLLCLISSSHRYNQEISVSVICLYRLCICLRPSAAVMN